MASVKERMTEVIKEQPDDATYEEIDDKNLLLLSIWKDKKLKRKITTFF